MKPRLEVLILAGGGGTRLWPLSREGSPKPLVPLAGGASPLERAAALARRIAGPGHVWVIASPAVAAPIRRHLRTPAGVRLILEPAPRDTAAALALGCGAVRRRTGAEWALCLPADQWIRRPAAFTRAVWRVVESGAGDHLITFGIRPTHAHPGYGYIELGGRIAPSLYRAQRFVEKPPLALARRYVRARRWLWNSGMFLWRIDTFLREVDRLLPSVARAVAALGRSGAAGDPGARRRWAAIKPVSVDHGIMEKARRVAVTPCEIGWQDVGSWEAVARLWPRAPDGTPHQGRYVSLGGQRCLVYAPHHLTVNLGVRGVGVAIRDRAILLFDRSQHERVKDVVEHLRRHPVLARYR